MSLSQLQKYLRTNPVTTPTTPQKTDSYFSRGNHLKRQISRIHPEKNIIFESKVGRNSKQAVDLIAAYIQNYRRKYGNILIILWTGICDLTSKVGQNRYGRKIIIDLNTVQVEDIVQQYNKFFEICSAYGDSVNDIILECLYYSISIWNSVQGHPYPSIFDQNKLILYHKINELNQNIKELTQFIVYRPLT